MWLGNRVIVEHTARSRFDFLHYKKKERKKEGKKWERKKENKRKEENEGEKRKEEKEKLYRRVI